MGRNTTRYNSGVFIWVGLLAVCGLCIGAGAVGIATADGDREFSSDGVTPTQFDSNESDVLWETDTALSTGAAPTVVDGILVTTTGISGGDGTVTAYDVGTGETRWTTEIPADGSPTVVDGTVYVTGADSVWALDLELGTLEWEVEFEDGTSSSRALGVDGEYVYVGSDGDHLHALDAEDGTEQWSKETATIYSGPTIVDGTVYVGTADELVAVDASDGEEQWTWDDYGVLEDRSAISEPTVSDGLLYVSLGEGTEQGGYDRSTVALDLKDGVTEWTYEFADPSGGDVSQTPTTPTVSGENGEETVYVAYDGLYALDAADGSERWTDETTVWDAPTVADGMVFVPQSTDSEALRALEVTDGEELWSVETGDRSNIIVVDGIAYVAAQTGDTRLLAIDAGVSGSSADSRVMLGAQNNHHAWTGEVPETEPRVVDLEYDEGVFAGDEVSVMVTARNDWGPTSAANYDLEIDGEAETVTLDVPAYGTNTADLSLPAPDEAGTYDLEVDGEVVGTITVVDESDPIVRDVQPFYETWLEGESIQIAYEATNIGTGDDGHVEEATLELEEVDSEEREVVGYTDESEALGSGETRTYYLDTDGTSDPGEYTAYLEGEAIGTVVVVPESDPVHLADTNRLHDSIISGVEAPVDSSAAGEASVDVRYENLANEDQSVDSELVAYDGGSEVSSVTETVDVGGESAVTARLSVPIAEAGTYDLEVDGQPVGDVEVLVDGVQDGDSIQDAIDAAQPGETILVGDGTYEESLTIDKELTLRSVSDGGAVLDGGDELERAITVESDDVTVDGFRIEGYSGGGEAVFIDGDRFTLRNTVLVDNDIDALSINRNSNEFSIDRNEIRRNKDGIADVDSFHASDLGTITNNTIKDNHGLGIDLSGDDHVIETNNVSGNENGISSTGWRSEIRHNNVSTADGTAIETFAGAIIEDNVIQNTPIGIEGNWDDLTVHANEFSGTETDLILDDVTDITVTDNQFATGISLSNVPDNLDDKPHEMSGNTVGGDPLVYVVGEDSPEIDSSAGQVILVDVTNLDLEGHSFSDVTAGVQIAHSDSVDVTGADFTDIGDGGAISIWHSSSVTVDDVDVMDAEYGVDVFDSDGVTVSNVDFTAVGRTAIHVEHVEDLSIVGNSVQDANRGLHVLTADELTVIDNVIEDSSTGVQFGRLSPGGLSTVENLTFTNNTITGSSGDGVKMDWGSLTGDVTVRDSIVRDNDGVGMDLDIDGVSATVENNTVRDNNGDAGFDLSVEGETVTVTNNTVRDNDGDAGFAIDVEGETATISNNVVTNNGADVGFDIEIETVDGSIESNTVRHNVDGLVVAGATATGVNVTITENLIEENTGTGLTVSDHFESVLVTENSIADNDDGFHYNRGDDVVLNATNNWWGAADGPSGDATDPDTDDVAEGSGNSITTSDRDWLDDESVRFSPWLEVPLVETGTITGTVTDDSDTPLEGATVVVTDNAEITETVETDEDGEYELIVPAGTYDLTVSADGYVEGEATGLEVTEDDTLTEDVELEAVDVEPETGTVAGQVTEAETDDPVMSAHVTATGGSDHELTLSDVDGKYELELQPGTYILEVFTEDVPPLTGTAEEVVVTDGETTTADIVVSPEPLEPPSTNVSVEILSDESTTSVTEGSELTVVASVENTGDEPAERMTGLGVMPATGLPDGGDGTVNSEMTTEVDRVEPLYESDLREISLEPGETTTETFTFESDLEFDGAEAIVIAAEPGSEEVTEFDTIDLSVSPDTDAPDLAVRETSVSNTEPETGDVVTITASVENVGEGAGDLVVPLEIDGETVDTVTRELEAGETEAVEFTHTFETGGEFDVSVGGEPAGIVMVQESADVSIFGASVDRTELLVDERAEVTANLYNSGDVEGDITVELYAEGEHIEETVIETETLTAEPGITRDAVEFEWTPTEEQLNGLDNDTVTIRLNDLVVETLPLENQYTDLQVIAASASETEVVQGEEFHVVGSLYQAGTIDGPETISLNATARDGDTEVELNVTDEVSLEPGFYHLGAVNLSASFDEEIEAGTYDLTLGERDAGELEVVDAYSDIQVIAASASETEVVQGEEFHAVGSIYQSGTIDGPQDISLNATHQDDSTETVTLNTSEDVSLEPGFYHLGAVNLSASFHEELEAGTYDLTLGERDAGELEVIEATTDIQVIAGSASETEVVQGTEFHTVGSIYQGGTTDGPQNISLNATHQDDSTETVTLNTSEDVSLEPGFYHLGAVNLSASFDEELEAGTYDLTLGENDIGEIDVIESYSDIQVIAASASETEVVQGEEFHAVGSLYQNGTTDGTQDISLNATHQDDSTETVTLNTSKDVSLEPGFYHLGAINLSATIDEELEAGTYDLTLGERDAGELEVVDAYSDLEVIAASPSEMNVTKGESFYVVGSIYQNGTASEPEDIELNISPTDGDEVHPLNVSKDVELEPGVYHLGAVNLSATIGDEFEAGTYDLTLGDRDAGTIGVEESPSDIQVIAGSVSEIEVLQDEEFYVVGSIYQNATANGGESFPETIPLTATPEHESGEPIDLGSETVELEPGVYHLGALNMSNTISDPGTYSLTLGEHDVGEIEVIETHSDLQVIAASASKDEIVQGEEFHAVGSIYQNGTVSEPEDIALNASPTDSDDVYSLNVSEDVELEPGVYHLGAINLSASFDEELEAGTYDLTLGDRDAGELEVVDAYSDIQVIAASASETEVVQGESFHAVGSLYQSGTVSEPEDVALNASPTDSDAVHSLNVSEDVELEPGVYHLGAVNLSATIDEDLEAGTYDLTLGERDAGQLEVIDAYSDLQVIAASASQTEVVHGEEFYVVGSIYQDGTVNEPENVSLTASHQDSTETVALNTSEDVSLEPGFYHLGAVNLSATFEEGQTGSYDLFLGEQSAGTLTVSEPTVDITEIDVHGHAGGIDPDEEHASDEATVDVTVESDLAVQNVSVFVDSLETNYLVEVDADHIAGEDWSASIPLEDLPDDGAYTLSALAVDESDTADSFASDRTLVIDREAPSLAVSLEDISSDDATVVVESTEPLADVPDVSATFTDDDGASESATVTMDDAGAGATTYTGTIEFDHSGNYSVTATGTDLAGNSGEDTTSAVIYTGFSLADETITIDETGTTIDFHVDDPELTSDDLFLAFSEGTVNANLDDDELGVGFLSAELDDLVDSWFDDGTIDHATISMPIEESDLADGYTASDVGLYHYDEQDTTWDPVESTITSPDSDPTLVADIDGFSTYGAIVVDDEPPEVMAETPSDGEVLDDGTDTVTVQLEYEDSLSGIDVSSVQLEVDGTDRTDHENTSITSSAIEHTISVEDGTDYDVWLSVADNAGNEATHELSFEVDSPSTGSPIGGGSGSSPPADDDTSSDDESSDTDDDESGADDDKPVSDDDAADDSDEETPLPADDDPSPTDDEASPTDDSDTPADGDDTASDAGSDRVPGFGVVVTIVTVLLVLTYLRRLHH
ncbi:PQQ-binding-like beta-propeller repeat protein [Natronolimnobius sp. AArcel1]|uniref:right-handed parallel beta-helix repeat-containing protein n=1 Tax=Natronolimnobius sp. AArcel1 TaxID=1679093 RepID=UPI0013EC4117|nr:right-handed parallel beta-helix repeat-containing protein [Natronolimnobius sp. AArcel1]NGM70519.1 PQQ-binding-like beta-propeller repeat protein [Natronolimnobius sp. AArcel1]